MKSINTVNVLWSILCLSILTSCVSPSSPQINIQAERIAGNQIRHYQSTQTQAVLTTLTPRATPNPQESKKQNGNLAPGQDITIKGFDFYSIDPLEAYADDMVVPYEAFVGLTRIDSETGKAGPGLATSWKVSKDQLTWSFKIRGDISWVRYDPTKGTVEQVTENGKVRYVTVDDIVYGISRILDPANESSNAFMLQDVIAEDNSNPIPGLNYAVRAVDDDTIEIKLKAPTSYFDAISELPLLAAQPEWLIRENPDGWLNPGVFTGYGPYVLKDWIPDQLLTLIRNPYWQGTTSIPEPRIQTITFSLTQNNSPAGDFIINSPEMSMISDLALVNEARDNPSTKKYLEQQPQGCVIYLTLNAKTPPLDQKEVRQALSLSINRESLIDDLYNGTQQAATQLSIPGSRSAPLVGTNKDSSSLFDLEKAKALLQDVYPDISKMPEITLTTTDTDASTNFGNQLHEMWMEALGIDVNIVTIPPADYYSLTESDNPPMITRQGYCLDYNDAANIFIYLAPNQSMPEKLGWTADKYEGFIKELGKEDDSKKRSRILSDLESFLVDDNAYVIPIYWPMTYSLVLPKLHRTYSAYPGLAQFEKWWVEE